MAKFKQKCGVCKKNYVETSSRNRNFLVCYECHKPDLQGEIKDAKMKKLFNIPQEFYEKNMFLRNIKINYLRYGSLTDKQIEAFKKSVEKMKEEQKAETV
ncbi:hypothetical protein ACFL1B_00480 [Nanoarchaeota archaeon]